MRFVILLMVALLGTVRGSLAGDAPAGAGLAPQFVEMAQNTLRVEQVAGEAHWRQSAALLEAATRLNPSEARYLRLLAEAQLELDEVEAAIETLTAYRRLEPADQGAQVRLIDLHLSRMETADERLAYVTDLLGRQAIAEEVRSHVAYRGASILWQRGEWERASSVLTQSLRLNPLNVEALRLRHEQFITEDRTQLERTAVVLQLLRANPAQPEMLEVIGWELARAGLVEGSLRWFDLAARVYFRSGQTVPHELVRAYAIGLFLSEQPEPAEELLSQIVEVNPQDVEAWFVRLAVHRQFAEVERFDTLRRQAFNALYNRVSALRREAEIAGAAAARELDALPLRELPDFGGDIERIREREDEALVEAYLSAVMDLAWFEVYFNARPEVGRHLTAVVRQALGEESVTVQRLAGWMLLAEENWEEAMQVLSKVADQDPLAAMGVLKARERIEPNRAQTATAARGLISANPTGLVGAMIWDGLRGAGARIVPSAAAEALGEEVSRFPEDWLRVLDRPERFYAIRGHPLQVGHGFAEPMLARVTIQNLSDYPLTVGPHGLIRGDLWFDARLRGVAERPMTGVAYERLTARLVLHPRQSMTQVVRVDQGMLSQMLRSNPHTTVAVTVHVLTNPATLGESIRPGPGGYRVQFTQLMERRGTPLGRDESGLEELRDRLETALEEEEPLQRLGRVEFAAAVARLLRAQEGNEIANRWAGEFASVVERSREDASVEVSAWAAYHHVFLVGEPLRPERIEAMAGREDWPARLLALVAGPALPPEALENLAERLRDDPEAPVRAYASALLEMLQAGVEPVEMEEMGEGGEL